MLSNPRIGQPVRLHYARRWREVPHITAHLHGRTGIVVVRGTGRPRNHAVVVDGTVYVVPAGNINKERK